MLNDTSTAGAVAGDAARTPASAPTSVSPALLIGVVLAQFGAFVAVFAPAFIALSISVGTLTPEDRIVNLGIVLAPGAFIALVAQPLFGRLSDRTTWSFGRRRSWILIGTLGGLVGLTILAFADSIAMLTIGWAIAQFFLNAVSCACHAVIPDQIPVRLRGRISAWFGIVLTGSQVIAVYLVIWVSAVPPLMYLVPGIVVAFTSTWLLIALRKVDVPADRSTLPPFTFVSFLGSFFVNPVKNRDYGIFWFGRLLVYLGYFSLITYQLYYVMSQLQLSQEAASAVVGNATFVTSIAAVVASLIAGWISDRTGKRKVVAVVAGVIMATGLGMLAFGETEGWFLIAVGIIGFGQGVYLAVDVAIVSELISDDNDRGKDMGVLNIANTLPQSIVPIVAPFLLAIGSTDGGENYAVLFLVGAVVALVGGVLVQFLRKVA